MVSTRLTTSKSQCPVSMFVVCTLLVQCMPALAVALSIFRLRRGSAAAKVTQKSLSKKQRARKSQENQDGGAKKTGRSAAIRVAAGGGLHKDKRSSARLAGSGQDGHPCFWASGPNLNDLL